MVLFKDMNKSATDVLNKDYCANASFEIEHKFKAKNPQFTATTSVGPSVNNKTVSVKFSEGNFYEECKFNSAGFTSLEANFNVSQVKGLKVGGYVDQKMEGAEVSAEYEANKTHFKFSTKPLTANFNMSAMSTMKYYGDITVGGDLSGRLDLKSTQYTCGVGFGSSTQSFKYFTSGVVSGSISSPLNKYAMYAHGTTNTSKQPSEYALMYTKSTSENNSNITFGGQWYVGDNTDTKIKAKVGADMKSSFSLTQKLSDYITASVGVQFDLVKQNADSVKYGMKFNTSS